KFPTRCTRTGRATLARMGAFGASLLIPRRPHQARMKSDEINEYITTFEHLRTHAGWECNAQGILDMFKKCLSLCLHWTTLQRDPVLVNIGEWIPAGMTASRMR